MDIIKAFFRQGIIIILTSNTIETTLCRLQEKSLSFVALHRRQSTLRACRRSKIKQMNLRSRATTIVGHGTLGTLWVIAAGAHEKLSWL